jgi:hypothetical protein
MGTFVLVGPVFQSRSLWRFHSWTSRLAPMVVCRYLVNLGAQLSKCFVIAILMVDMLMPSITNKYQSSMWTNIRMMNLAHA